mgnify:CR=1 FL=1
MREIQKCTDPDSPDHQNIEIAIQRFDDAAAEIDKATGIANNRYRINELYESYSKQSDKGVVGKVAFHFIFHFPSFWEVSMTSFFFFKKKKRNWHN